jgi:hypothetical protein
MDSFADLVRRLRKRWVSASSGRGGSGLPAARDPAWTRRPEVESDRVLAPATLQWLELLPEFARPAHFCERFPRVANQVAAVWADRRMCKAYFETLIGDDRGGRAGFGPVVRKEIVRLRAFHERAMSDAAAEHDWKRRAAATPIARAARARRQASAGT